MTAITVAVCQWDPRAERRDSQFDALERFLVQTKPELLLLPEMPFGPWICAQQPVDLAAWDAVVADHEAALMRLTSLPVPVIVSTRPVTQANGQRLNRAYGLEGGHVLDIHDKYYLPDEPGFWEASWYDRGDGRFIPARLSNTLIGVQVCTEMWFHAATRSYMKAGVELLCVPRATGPGSLNKWLAGGRAAAVVAGAYCLSSNLWLPEADQGPEDLGGLGWITDPDGEVMVTTSPDKPFAAATIELDQARAAKKSYPRYVRE